MSDLPNNSETVSIGGDLPTMGVLKGRQEHGAATVRQIPLLSILWCYLHSIYAHAFDKNKRKAQEKLGKAIGL